MNTMDALWLSAFDADLATARRHAEKAEGRLQTYIDTRHEFSMSAADARSAAMAHRAVAERFDQIANQISQPDTQRT